MSKKGSKDNNTQNETLNNPVSTINSAKSRKNNKPSKAEKQVSPKKVSNTKTLTDFNKFVPLKNDERSIIESEKTKKQKQRIN